MISKLDVMIKCVTLLYREKELYVTEEQKTDNSIDLIKTVLNVFRNDKRALQGGESIVVNDLQNLVSDMIQPDYEFDKETLLQSLGVVLKNNDSIYKILEKAIETEMENGGLKNSIVSLRKFLTNYYKQVEIGNLISKANYDIHANRINESIADYISNLVISLESLNSQTKAKDPGLISELDITDEDSIANTVEEVKDLNANNGKFQTGWKEVNKMVNAGFRRGEMWAILALQHNYKSGFMQSLFCQFCMYNKPKLEDPKKKPMVLYISFEDDMNIIAEFMYRYLYWNEFNKAPDLTSVTNKEVATYIKSKLSINGFYGKILRVDPSEWTYKNIFNTILQLEVQGYEVQALFLDYLSKLPTTFCEKNGPMGTDVRDLYNRVRNYISAKKIVCLTAHQLSSDALTLYRNRIQGYEFLDEVVAKNYYSESRQIPQVVDGEIYLTKGKMNKQWALFIAKGKHRSPTITLDEDKQCHLMFPKEKLPIKENINDEDVVIGDGIAEETGEFEI